jgi:excisionase family DNA binding protein
MTAPKTRHLTTEELAERLGVSVTTVRDWRRDGRGPAYIRVGSVIRYRETDIDKWERAKLVDEAA